MCTIVYAARTEPGERCNRRSGGRLNAAKVEAQVCLNLSYRERFGSRRR